MCIVRMVIGLYSKYNCQCIYSRLAYEYDHSCFKKKIDALSK